VDRVRRALTAVVIAYLFIGFAYATLIPQGKGPDETAHVRYVEFLAAQHRLPVFDPAHPDPNYEFHQPPLYYALAAPVYALAKDTQAGQQGIRILTLILSLPLLYLTFALGRLLVKDEPWVAVAATGVVAFLPMQLSVVTSIGNDALAEVFAAAVLLLLVSSLQPATASPKRPLAFSLWVGVLIGLGMLTKSTSVLLFPLAWLAVAFRSKQDEGFRWRQWLTETAALTLAALVVCGWWLVRNQLLYGDPMAQKVFLKAFVGLRPSPQSFMTEFKITNIWDYIGQVIIWTMASVTGVFGPVRANRFIFLPYQVYFATGLLAVAAALGCARYLGRTKLERWQRQAWWLCGVYTLLLVLSFIQFNLSFFQAQARYLFPMLPAAGVAFGLGLATLFPSRFRPIMLGAVTAALAVLAWVLLHLWIVPKFLTL
jgi:hypothetical protein